MHRVCLRKSLFALIISKNYMLMVTYAITELCFSLIAHTTNKKSMVSNKDTKDTNQYVCLYQNTQHMINGIHCY